MAKEKNTVKIIWYADKIVIITLDQMAERSNASRDAVLSSLVMSELEKDARNILALAPKTPDELAAETLRIRRSKAKGENNG